jgi:hypothetical protein
MTMPHHRERARRGVGRRSKVEFIAQRLGDDGAEEEEGGGHGVMSRLAIAHGGQKS